MREVEAFFDSIAGEYDRAYIRPVDMAEDHLTAVTLYRHISKGDYVLDVGCGTGHTLMMVQPSHYVGIDISWGMLRRAESRWPRMSFVFCDMEDLSDFRGFDVVVCLNGVGLYARDFEAFVEELCVTTTRAVILSMPLPAQRGRKVISNGSPGETYQTLDTIRSTFERMFREVRVTTYSSWLHDRFTSKMLGTTGVRWPRWARPYYCIVEATL